MEKVDIPEIPNDDSFKVVFTGNIGTAQGLQILPKAAEYLKEENVKFVMIGDGRYLDEFSAEVERRDVAEKFIMVPRQPAERIPELLAACDVAFLSFQDAELWTMTIPAKLQSYMACGMPILAAAKGETERVIKEAECGVCCDIGDASGIAEKIRELMGSKALGKMGENAIEYCRKHFDKRVLMDEMDEYMFRGHHL